MNKLHLWKTIGLIIIVFYLFLAVSAVAKDFSIPEIQIEVQVNPDGTLQITEHRNYVFDGSYSWANYNIPKEGFTHIRDIQVSEGENFYTNLNSEEPGTFLVEESDNNINLKWYYEASDEERIFTISYTLEGAITIGVEWSQIYWNFASAGREKSTDQFSATVNLPNSPDPASLHSWVREPHSKLETGPVNDGLKFTGSNISRSEAVIIRLVFPTDLFNRQEVSITDSGFSLEWAREDEESIRREQEERVLQRAYLFGLGSQFTLLIIVLSIAGFVFVYRRYGSRHKSGYTERESLMIPGDLQPAAIGWLLASRNITGNHLMATFLDLARKDYFIIKEQETEDKWYSSEGPEFTVASTDKEPGSDVTEWEKSFIRFFRSKVHDDETELKELFKSGSSGVAKWFSEWKKEVKKYCFDQKWFDMESYKGVYLNIAIQVFLLIGSIIGLILTHEIMGLAALFTIIAMIFSLTIIRRTPKGEEIYTAWSGYKKALSNAKDHSVPDNQLGLHFIYSVAFGVGKKNIEVLFEENPDTVHSIYWIAILSGSSHTPADIAASFSTLAATGASSFAGTTGSAGGASAGAAGGGASGGAG